MNTNLQYWQRNAHSACFEMNQKLKQVSERTFYDFSQSPDMNTLLSIISNGSDTLVFAMFSYLSKYPNFFAKNFTNVTYLITCINSWELRAFTFVRSNHPPFQKYVTRTIMASLGIFLKILYQNVATSNELLNFLQNLQSKYFKLYLLKCFVDAVEVVDYDMGYISYRLMVYSFQDNAIPMICEVLMPYFYSIEEGVQMTELSFLQQNLNVSDDAMTNSQQKLTISSEQQLETDFVFILLQKIVEFNYNITYSEYESDQPIETCLISFPQKVAQKILNHEFLNALFFIIDKVSDAKIRERKHEYLQISLNCVAKMMQSRLAYLKDDVKEQFIYHSIKGLTLLLMKCHQIGSQTLLKGILVCNKRLYMSCQLMYLKQITCKLSVNNKQELYNVYIQNLTNAIILVVKGSSIQIENHLLPEAMELSNKIILSYGFRDEENIDQEYLFFSNFIKSIIKDFIQNLCIPHSILQSYTIISIAECKALVNQLFEKFKRLASINFSYLFERIQQQLNQFTRSQQRSPIQFANILFILSQLIDHNFLQRNILLNEAKDSEYCQLGIIVNTVLTLIKQYVCNRHLYKSPQSIYVNAAIIIFIQSISIDFLIGFEFIEKIQIKQKLFQFMTYGQTLDNLNLPNDSKSQETLLNFIYILVNYVQTQNQKEQELTLTQYSLDIIERCIMKIKWRLRLQTYEKAVIVQYLQDFFQKLFYSGMTHCDIRTRASKIIALLTLQSIDDYKFRIDKYISIMKMQSIKIIQYDLIGIFEGIQSHAIVKYLYRKINKDINIQQLFDSLFLKAKHENNEKQYRDLTKLLSVLLYNKYFRSPSSITAYENFKSLLPYLIELLKMINKDNDIDMDLWESSLTIIFELFKGFSTGMINIFLLQTYTNAYSSTNLVQQFVIQIIKSLVLVSQNLKQYPELQPIVLNVMNDVNKELLDYIFKDQTRKLPYAHAFLIAKIINICNDYMKLMLHGNKVQEERLMLCFNSLQSFYSYFNRKRKMVHQSVTIANLQEHYQLLQNFDKQAPKKSKNEQFIDNLLNFIISNHKNNLTYLRKIAKLLFQLNQSFRPYVTRSIINLHVSNEKLLEIQEILSYNQQETFVDKMKTWVREIDIFGM